MATISNILPWIQIIFSILLVTLILLQQSEAGLGSAFGGSGGEGGVTHTRRGGEKVIFQTTIVVAILFVLSVGLSLIV